MAGWLLFSLHPVYTIPDFSSVKERKIFWTPPLLGEKMKGKRYEQIGECICLRKSEDIPKHRDILFWMLEPVSRFNRNMTKLCSAACIVCVDKYVVVFYNKYATVWVAVNKKPVY